MNPDLRHDLPITTQAAEGLPRRRWTVAEIEAMVRAGVIDEDERFELIGGEVVPMPPKGILHETLKGALIRYWVPRLPQDLSLIPQTTFRLTLDSFVEPDFVFFRRADGLKGLSPATALLAVEVADTSLRYDLGRKIRVYAGCGVREVWVIDAERLVTHIHREPSGEAYAHITQVLPGDVLAFPGAPELDVRLAELPPV